MFTSDQYELLDFGDGRKLERFGKIVLDRFCPAAESQPRLHRQLWHGADARYDRKGEDGSWKPVDIENQSWQLRHHDVCFELRCRPFGHIGLFAEQAENWDWIARQVTRAKRPLRVLNLFAYTGGSTLAAAAAGAEVVHVDAARNVVAWARKNAKWSGLDEAPIRWICEDAAKFARRELRRGNAYDAVILDPPSYGHGPKGEPWKIERHLLPLLQTCAELTANSRAFFLLTCHSDGFGAADVEAMFADAVFGHCQAGARARPLSLCTNDGRQLPSGIVARWPN